MTGNNISNLKEKNSRPAKRDDYFGPGADILMYDGMVRSVKDAKLSDNCRGDNGSLQERLKDMADEGKLYRVQRRGGPTDCYYAFWNHKLYVIFGGLNTRILQRSENRYDTIYCTSCSKHQTCGKTNCDKSCFRFEVRTFEDRVQAVMFTLNIDNNPPPDMMYKDDKIKISVKDLFEYLI